jgi:hypothetical protein
MDNLKKQSVINKLPLDITFQKWALNILKGHPTTLKPLKCQWRWHWWTTEKKNNYKYFKQNQKGPSLGLFIGTRSRLLKKKPRGEKSRGTVPLKVASRENKGGPKLAPIVG